MTSLKSLNLNKNAYCVCFLQWALIARGVKTIIGLALDFHNIQQTLSAGGTASDVRTRCEMEVDRIEMQFDECVVFLLRVGF
jgi:gamma-tubulin complex component 5